MKNQTNQEHGKFTAPGEIRFVRLLPGPIDRVWAYLTDPKLRATWLGGGPMDLRVGGAVELQWDHARLTPHNEEIPDKYKEMCAPGSTSKGRVTRCEPPRVLSYTFGEVNGGESEVTFELTAQGSSTHLVLVHRKLGDDRATVLSVAAGWHAHVDIMIARLSDATPSPFWATHNRLESEYEKMLSLSAKG